MSTDFTPGAYWTPDRARAAAASVSEQLASPQMQALMREIETAAAAGADPAATTAQMAPIGAAHPASTTPVRAAACHYRRGRSSDIPAFAQLIIAGDLPPLFIQEFVEGFVAVEHEGEIIGCGGLEIYGDSGVIRSIVVDERGRAQNIAQEMTGLLVADARAAGISDLYLFTMHAHNFWLRLGFVDVPLDAWKELPRACWQYQFVSQFPAVATGVYSMWRAA
jgi:amino-acid N-acetyltransferase